VPELPQQPSLEHLRKQPKASRRARAISLSQAQPELAREYGFASWRSSAITCRHSSWRASSARSCSADASALSTLVRAEPQAATATFDGLPPLLVLLRRSMGSPADVRSCARLLLDAGADPDSHTVKWDGQGRMSALFGAVERSDLELVRLLLERGATRDEDALYHACDQSNTTFLDELYEAGFESLVNHKLDFEDAAGLHWFLDHGVDVNAKCCLDHAISRGRGLTIVTMLLDASADPNLPWDRWDTGRRPLALAARCGHLAAYELLRSRGASAELDPVDEAVLAVARSESVGLPKAPPPSLGNPRRDDYGWILGQFALLGRTDVVEALLDAGMEVDARGWSNFTPLDQAAMHGRTETVRLLIERGADLEDCAFTTGDDAVDALLTASATGGRARRR
jgi:ankyrin repeat protein